ncbi:MAG: PAS domain-containing protein, partial [Desulfuromonadaceae bacterium]
MSRKLLSPASSVPGTSVDALQLLHRSQVRQHELEKQIEELRKANEELEKSRNKYAFLYDVAPVGYATLDRSGDIQTVNLTGAMLLGMERSALTGLGFEQFVAAEDRPAFADFLKMVFACRDKKTCRLKLANVGGPPLYVRIDMRATASGNECQAALLDITERKRSEEALRESEYKLSKAQAMSHVGSWISNPTTGDLSVSDELLRIMRLNHGEATQEMFASLVHPDDLENVMRHLRRGIELGSNY